jgi:ABC-type multidrug transport system fused ATPase/permease subunit
MQENTEIVLTASQEETPQTDLPPAKAPGRFVRSVGKLKPLLPYLTGGLRLIDHGAAQIVAQLLTLATTGNTASSEAHSEIQSEIQQELAEIEASHRDLRLSVQDHSLELKRFEDQIVLLRQAVERNAAEHTAVAAEIDSLRKLVIGVGLGLGLLLLIIIVLGAFLLAHY